MTPRPLPADAFTRAETYAATRLPVDFASTIVPDAFTSDAFFELERHHVFARGWVAVGVTSELEAPGQYLVVQVAGQSVIVTRNRAGELRGFHNVCRHRGARLVGPEPGRVERFFSCPYHAWAYDLDGHCLGTPLFTPESKVPLDQRAMFDVSGAVAFDKADHGLHPVRVETWGCLVFACLDPDAAPLTAHLGDLPARLEGMRMDEWRLVRRKEYSIGANWKLVAENFMEYYHLPWVHPGLVKVSPMSAHHRWQGRGMYVGFCTSPIAQNTDEGGWLGLPALPGIEGFDAESARFAWIFPNLALNVMPNHVFLLLVRPTAAGRTEEVAYLLTHAGAREAPGADQEIDELMRFWDEVNQEDIAIVERVQDGLSNLAYTGGRMCYRFEESVHRFENMVIDRMLGIDRVPEGDDDAADLPPSSATPTAPAGVGTPRR